MAVVLALAAGTAVVGDEIWVDKLHYASVQIVGVESGQLVFILGGNRVRKPLASITRIVSPDLPALSKAEELLSERRYDKAIAAYKAAGVTATGWRKTLLERRLALAQTLKANPPVAPTPTTASAPTARCYWCGGTGWMPCRGCRAGNMNTGKGRCPECNGTGKVSCPDCEGRCCRKKCNRCRGSGQVVVRTVRSGAMVRKVYGPCQNCGGTGFEDYCRECCKDDKKMYGKVQCFACKGVGRYGDCPSCKATKRVPCVRCPAGRKRREEFGRIAASQPAVNPKIFRIISSPRAFVKEWPKPPDTSKMTTLQWAIASKEYGERTAALRNGLVGRDVRWQLRIEDVRPVEETENYVLVGRSSGGIEVQVIFKKDQLGMLSKLRKKQMVLTVGKVATWPAEEEGHPPTLVGPDNQIRLMGKSIETADDE